MQTHAWQLDLFGEALPISLRKMSRSSLLAVHDIIKEQMVEEPKEVLETSIRSYPRFFHGLDVDHPTNIFEIMLADRIKAAYLKPNPILTAIEEIAEDEEEEVSVKTIAEEEGGGMVGAHKKLLKLSLEDLRNNRDIADIASWIMDGTDQARLFSFDACCRVSEIDPDSLRTNLIDGGFIPRQYIH